MVLPLLLSPESQQHSSSPSLVLSPSVSRAGFTRHVPSGFPCYSHSSFPRPSPASTPFRDLAAMTRARILWQCSPCMCEYQSSQVVLILFLTSLSFRFPFLPSPSLSFALHPPSGRPVHLIISHLLPALRDLHIHPHHSCLAYFSSLPFSLPLLLPYFLDGENKFEI